MTDQGILLRQAPRTSKRSLRGTCRTFDCFDTSFALIRRERGLRQGHIRAPFPKAAPAPIPRAQFGLGLPNELPDGVPKGLGSQNAGHGLGIQFGLCRSYRSIIQLNPLDIQSVCIGFAVSCQQSTTWVQPTIPCRGLAAHPGLHRPVRYIAVTVDTLFDHSGLTMFVVVGAAYVRVNPRFLLWGVMAAGALGRFHAGWFPTPGCR